LKQTLVFIPGLAGTTSYWRGHLGVLDENYHVVYVDPLGFGQSPKPWTCYTIAAHLESLHHAISKYAPFTLVGYSMGSLLALAYAARYPKDVQALTLLSLPFYANQEKAMRTVRQSSAFNRVFFGNMALAAFICILTRRVFGWLAPYLPTGLPREVAADTVKHSWCSFTSSLWEVIYKYDVRQDVIALGDSVPVLCIHGDKDRVAPLEGAQTLASGSTNWRVQVLAGIDHHPLFQAPAATLQAIVSSLPEDQ